jgi:hypothetical protein
MRSALRRVIKEVRAVQFFLSCRRAAVLPVILLAAGPAHAVTLDSALDDARDIAVTTGENVAAFFMRITAGDMTAIQGAVFGFCALIGLIGLWLLLLRVPREEAVIIAMDEGEQEPLILNPPSYTPAQPAPSPTARPGAAKRPTRLLEAVAAARAQYEITLAER